MHAIDLYIEDFGTSNLIQSAKDAFSGPCPQCGGKDRFVLWTSKDQFYCRGCEAKGNSVEYLKIFRGLSVAEACKLLNYQAKNSTYNVAAKEPTQKKALMNTETKRIKVTCIDRNKWAEQAELFLSECQSHIMDQASVAYLEQRFIDPTIAVKYFGFGFNPKHQKVKCELWGVRNSTKDNFSIPSGLILPTFQNDKLISLEVKCIPKFYDNKHFVVSGSVGSANYILKSRCFGLPGYDDRVVICESILDASVLYQVSCGTLTCVATRSAVNVLSAEVLSIASNAKYVFLAYDGDDAGKRALKKWAKSMMETGKRLNEDLFLAPAIGGKDVTDAHKAALHGDTKAFTVDKWLKQAVWSKVET